MNPLVLVLIASGPLPFDGTRDDALDRAAKIHATAILEGPKNANLDAVHDALDACGLSDPEVLPFAAKGTSDATFDEALLRFVAQRARPRGATHYGIGRAKLGIKRSLVALFVKRRVSLPPLPRQPSLPGIGIRGLVLQPGPMSSYLTSPSGAVHRLSVTQLESTFNIDIPFSEGPGIYTFQLAVETQQGPQAAAMYTFFAGVPVSAPPRPPEWLRLPDSIGTIEALIQRERVKIGAHRLSPHLGLTRAAQRHAEFVCDALEAVHVTPDGSTPSTRAAKVGFNGVVAENIAIAATVARAHRNLVMSPVHRKNILDAKMQSIGIGLAHRTPPREGHFAGQTYCIVEVFGTDQPVW